MKRVETIALKPYVLGFFCVCMFVALSSFKFGAFGANASKKQINPIVRSLFPELEITEVKQLGEYTLQVIVRNGYKKDITAVVASVGPYSAEKYKIVRADYIAAELEKDQKLSSGASDMFLFDLGGEIVIRAVVFADRTSEGDHRQIKEVFDKRLGRKIQLARINPHLERLGKADGPLIRTEIQRVRQIAENLPIEQEGMSEGLEYGLRDGRADILIYLSKMETELENEKVEVIYDRANQPMTIVHGGEVGFREMAARFEKHFKSLEHRL